MTGFSLIPHPDYLPKSVKGVVVEIGAGHGQMLLTYRIESERAVRMPPPSAPERVDDLWRTTCFELFLKDEDGPGYVEFNFSPSSRWAAYAFEGYRAGRVDLALAASPRIERCGQGWKVVVDLADLPSGALTMGLSTVIEETDGTKSYWALAHASGPPDFHNPGCFIARLPA